MKYIAFFSLIVALCGCGGAGTRCAASANANSSVSPNAIPDASSSPNPPDPPQVPEGTLVTIRGRYVPDSAKHDYYSANMTQNLFDVNSIDGKPISLRAELVDPPAAEENKGELTLVGYFYRAVSTGSLVEGFDPPDMQGHAFSYALKFKVKRPSK